MNHLAPDPSAKALGYSHSVRFADAKMDFCSKADEVFDDFVLSHEMSFHPEK
jgi:hypothetical protein